MSDWTVPMDDGLVARLTHCTHCGDPAPRGLFGVYPRPVVVAYWFCGRCLAADPDRHTLEARLAERYAGVDGRRDDPAKICRV